MSNADSDDATHKIAHAFVVPCRLLGLEVSDEHHLADLQMIEERDLADEAADDHVTDKLLAEDATA